MKENRRTKQFRACNIAFSMPMTTSSPTRTASLHILYTATTAGRHAYHKSEKRYERGSCISHTTSGTKACHVKALGHRVHYIMNHSECNEDDIISTYNSPRTRSTRPLRAGDINKK
jgi:hypothetical protein